MCPQNISGMWKKQVHLKEIQKWGIYLKKQIIQEASGNFIKIEPEGNKTRGEKIFSYGEIPGFLPLEVRCINGEKEYYYPITGKVSLKQYLTETEFDLSDMKALFSALFQMAETVEEYLLDSRGVLLEEDYIFVDCHSKKYYGVYLEDSQNEFIPSISRLLEFVMEKMNQKKKDLVFFIYGMHKQTKEENCSRLMLEQYVREEEAEGKREKQKELPEPLKERPNRQTAALSGEKRIEIQRVYIWAAGIGLVGVLCPFVLWKMGIFTIPVSGATDYGKWIAAILFFWAVSGYGVWRLVQLGKKKENRGIIFSEEEEVKVCLIPQLKGAEPVPIALFPFRLGSDEKMTHLVIPSGHISKIHAEIRQEGNCILLVDEESHQGTFWNGQRLTPWQPVPLKDGDVIELAEFEYVVEITQSHFLA